MLSPEVQLESSNSSVSDLGIYSLGGHEISSNYTDGERDVLSDSEDVDIQMRLCCGEGLSDDKACMWLCSGGTSTSFLSSDDLQSLEILDIHLCDALLSGRSATLPALDEDNGSTGFDGSAIGLVEASPVLIRMQGGVGADLNDDGNKAEDSSKASLACLESVRGTSDSNGSWQSLGTHIESSPSEGGNDFDGTDIWVSSLDLDKEESEWDTDRCDTLGPDFPSPSYRILANIRVRPSKLSFCPSFKSLLEVQPSSGSPSSIFDLSPKHALLVDSPRRSSRADEPLFWPFDCKSYWRPEFEGNYLGISPRASLLRIKRPRGRHSPRSVRVGLQHNRNDPSLHKENIRQGYGRKILISSKSAKPALADRKTGASVNRAPHPSIVPSRLRRSTAASSDETARKPSKKKGEGRRQTNSGKQKRGRDQKSALVEYLLGFEAGDFQVYSGGEVPIEALVGLAEFDGLEGVGKMTRAG